MSKDIGIQISSETANYECAFSLVKNSEGLIEQGLIIGNIVPQNQALILIMEKGELKEYPKFGVGINGIINDNELEYWKKEIVSMMEQDGMSLASLELTTEGLKIEGGYRK
jgi:hypothetical protein